MVRSASMGSISRQRPEHLGQLVVVDGLAVAGQALVDPGQVGARVRADGQPVGHEQLGQDPGRRALAVGARHVDHRARPLGVAEQPAQARIRSRVGAPSRVGMANS